MVKKTIYVLILFFSLFLTVDALGNYNGIISADALVVHESSIRGSATITELAYGTRVFVLDDKAGGSYGTKITFDNGKTGFVSSSYVLNVDAAMLTSGGNYDEYCNALVTKGFHRSYCPYLYYLHTKYPNWNFEAQKIGKTLNEVALEEEGKTVLQTSNSNYWLNSNYIEGSYYYINAATIMSFLDPRNSLFEKHIFQFLDLQSSKDISNNAAMSKIVGNGNLSKYLDEFKQAGANNGVNPLHVLSRSIQEGANSQTYSSVSGTYSTTYNRYSADGYSLDGYYNFFNIGAYADSVYPYTVQRGLAYASGFISGASCVSFLENGTPYYDNNKCGALSYQRPWNTTAKAISGGTEFISEGYIKKGQNTGYYQKFNISPTTSYPLYSHQYMTNIYAPASEASTMYTAYKAGNLLSSNFNFIIPVFEGMGDDTVQPVDKSSNNNLSSLVIEGSNIAGFDKDRVEYSYNITTDKTEIQVTATPEDSKATVSGVGTVAFDALNNAVVQVVVTAENGNTKTYVVYVKRIIPDVPVIKAIDVVNKMGVRVNGDVMYGISPGMQIGTIVNTVTASGGSAILSDVNGNVLYSGLLVTGNRITINGTNDALVYTIAVRGDTNGDGNVSIVDLLQIQKHILGKGNLDGYRMYAGDTNYDGKISIVDLLQIQKHILGKGNL